MVRVLKAEDVLDPNQTPQPDMPQRDSLCSVEELLPLLAAHKEGIVATHDSRPVGVVTANSVIAALDLAWPDRTDPRVSGDAGHVCLADQLSC